MIWIGISLSLLFLMVIYLDTTRYLIPNWLVLTLIALWPPFLLLTPESWEWYWHPLVALAAFIVGLPIHHFRYMGGGDIKLLVAACLWTGTQPSIIFLIYAGLFGGILAIILLVMRPVYIAMNAQLKTPLPVPRMLTIGQPVPYGIAIALGFLVVLWMGLVPGLGMLHYKLLW
jgi:prepilin peptidase CpaA